MNDAAEAYRQQQEVLRGKFATRALDEADQLEKLAGTLATGDSVAIREDIGRLAHRMAGASGTFGFVELTAPADALETTIRNAESDAVVTEKINLLTKKIREVSK